MQGLGADPNYTWERNGINWLRDLLPLDASRARIMAWGEIARFTRNVPEAELEECSKRALMGIHSRRMAEQVFTS